MSKIMFIKLGNMLNQVFTFLSKICILAFVLICKAKNSCSVGGIRFSINNNHLNLNVQVENSHCFMQRRKTGINYVQNIFVKGLQSCLKLNKYISL